MLMLMMFYAAPFLQHTQHLCQPSPSHVSRWSVK